MKGLLTLVVLIAVSAGVFALGTLRRQSDDKPIVHVATEVALNVKTATPVRERIIRLVQAPGDVEAVSEIEVSSEIVAKIEEMPVEEGDIVKKGDLLCRLDDTRLRAEVESGKARIAQLRAAIRQADADLELAQRDLDTQKSLSELSANSQREMADYYTIFKKTRAGRDIRVAELVQAEAFLKRIQEDLKRTVITSAIDGIVSTLKVKQGEIVVTGTMNNPGTVIMTISDLSKMQVRTRVDEIDVPLVKPGQHARVFLQSDPDKPVPARVVRVASKGSKRLDRDVVTFEALLEVLSDDERIKPGMTANVEIEVARRDDTLTVPVEAIVHRMRKDLPERIVKVLDQKRVGADLSVTARQAQYVKVVYTMDDDVARVHLVDVGINDPRRAEILSGVGPGDTVITGPYRSLDQLKDGKKVALFEKPKTAGEKDSEAGDGDDAEAKSAAGSGDGKDRKTEGKTDDEAKEPESGQEGDAEKVASGESR
ncbi:MAG: efflux RND transporter periplasmic adaptor subunit [Phycisphaerae bacterium]